MTYEFQNVIYPTRKDLCEAIAIAWLSANGKNTRDEIEKIVRDTDAYDLTCDCLDGYGLSDEWLWDRGIDAMQLYTGFLSVIESLD